MEKGCYVKDIESTAEVSGTFVVSQALQSKTGKGDPYWRLTLTDASGSVEAMIWQPLSTEFADIPVGSLVYAEGRAGIFRDQVQVTVTQMYFLTEQEQAEIDTAMLLPSSPYPLNAMLDELQTICREEFDYAPWRKLVSKFFAADDMLAKFRVCPAAKGIHHAYAGGLLEHTLGVVKLCRSLADLYHELDRQVLLAGALFHDIGKIREFSGGVSIDYTDDGRLLGHIVLGVLMLEPFLAGSNLSEGLQQHLKHLILSHHGELQYGAARLPQTAEAIVLHYADNLDAKLAQCRGLFAQQASDGLVWTPWQKSLERQLYRAERTPERILSEKSKKVVQKECLSLLKV